MIDEEGFAQVLEKTSGCGMLMKVSSSCPLLQDSPVMAPSCIQTLFSRKPRSVQAQQRVDRDTSGADQEFLHSVDPSSLSEWLPDDGQGFAMSKCAAVDRVNLPFCETFTTSHGKPDVLDLRAALWSSHTSRTSQNKHVENTMFSGGTIPCHGGKE